MNNLFVKAHTSFLGKSGYNNHSRNFFTALNKIATVKVRNFSMDGCNLFRGPDGSKVVDIKDGSYVDVDWKKADSYLTGEHQNMLIEQTYLIPNGTNDIKFQDYEFPEPPIHIILNEVEHHYFVQDYPGKKVGYFAWETDAVTEEFFHNLTKFDQVWVPSKWQRNCLIKQGYDSTKIKIVPEAVDLDFEPNLEKNSPNEKMQFLIVGRWDYRKSTTDMIKSFLEEFKNGEDVELVLNVDNGYTPEGLPRTTEDKLKYFKCEDPRIKIKHFLDRNSYIDLIRNSDVFVSCARGEGWNLPLIEAMACGIPSIYSECSGQMEFAEGKGLPVDILRLIPSSNSANDGFNYGFTPGNYYEPNFDTFKKHLRYVYENWKEVRNKALEESKSIRNIFTWENSAKIASMILSNMDTKQLPRRAYVSHVTENCFEAIDGLVNSVLQFSKHPIILYTVNFDTDKYKYNSNVITIRKDFNEINSAPNRVVEGNKEYVDRFDNNTYYILRIKPNIMMDAIHSGVEEAVYLDGDTIILPNADELFDKLPEVENYPLISRGVFEIMAIGDNYDIERPLMDYLNVPHENREFYLQSNTILFNKNCYDFIKEWNDVSYDSYVTDHWKEFCPYSDETIVNVLLWKHKYKKRLPLTFYNVGSFQSFIDFWNFDDSDKSKYNHEMQCFRIQTDSENAGWQCIPWNKSDVKILHNIKNVGEGLDIVNYINYCGDKPNILYITEHLSTGGLPQVLLKRIDTLKDDCYLYVVEITNYGSYDVQRKKVIELVGEPNFFSLGLLDESEPILSEKRSKLLSLINVIKPDYIHFEEIPELTTLSDGILKLIYKNNRTYKIIESTHTSTYDTSNKRFLPDKFMFVSKYNYNQYKSFGVPIDVVEYPIEDNTWREKHDHIQLDPNFKHVLNVGLFTPGKNQGYIFELAKRLLDYKIKFHFIGNQAGNFIDYWTPLMDSKPDNCIVWGERSDVDQFYLNCDLFFFSSIHELNPLVIKEALGYNIPIVMKNLNTYCGVYDNNEKITFTDLSNIDSDVELIINKLNINREKSKIAVLTAFDKKYSKIGNVSKRNFQRYCKKHQYDFVCYERESSEIEGLNMAWYKIKAIRELLPKYEYIFWLDADCLFMNHDIRLESFICEDKDFTIAKHKNFVDTPVEISGELTGLIANAMLIRRSELSMEFFDDAWKQRHSSEHFDYEQRILKQLFNSNVDYKNKLNVVDERLLNTFWYNNTLKMIFTDFENWNEAYEMYKRGDFIIHFAGHTTENRYKFMTEFDSMINKEIPTNIKIDHKFDIGSKLSILYKEGIGVEIGVLNGELSKEILSRWNGTLYMVDSWRHIDGYIDDNSRDDNYHIDCLKNAIESTSKFQDRAHIIRMLSVEASKLFPDNFFDFIFIDADHKYSSVMEDLNAWFPKLKPGGLFSGDDYIPDDTIDADVYFTDDSGKITGYAGKFGVTPAVNEFAKARGYTVGVTNQQYFRQWYFIK